MSTNPEPQPEELVERLRLWRKQNPGNWYGNRDIDDSMEVIKRQAFELAALKGLPPPVFFNPNPFGLCPHCNAPGISREKCINGNDTCEKGHCYPSRAAIEHTRDPQL
uniref:Uncharacterized protein n=1 Tax=Pseudomonas phage Cygsa01 TaxID=3138529 RepID=A0AAU6W357_9VIRU